MLSAFTCLVIWCFTGTRERQWFTSLSKSMLLCLSRGVRAGIWKENEVSVSGKPQRNYTDPCKASHTYRVCQIQNFKWIKRNAERWLHLVAVGKVQADSNTHIFLSDSIILNVYIGRTECACPMQFLLLSVKHHLPPEITVLNTWGNTWDGSC